MDVSNIKFNVYKHHLGSIRELIPELKNIADLKVVLKRFGNSTLDLYYGSLSLDSIKTEISVQLNKNHIADARSFSKYLNANNGFQNLSISDGSTWTLRKIRGKQFVHIHPARYSEHSIRTNGATLKTVVATKYLNKSGTQSLVSINKCRELIGLPSIKKIIRNRGIDKLFKLF